MAARVSMPSDDLPALMDPFAAMPFELILDDSDDVDFSHLAGEAWGFVNDDDGSSTTTTSSSSAVCDELLTPPPSPPPATEESEKPAQRKRKRVPQSQRVKAEKAFLSEQIAALERQLAESMVKSAITNCTTQRSAWRAVARRQYERRSAVEMENQRLRVKFNRQLQVAKSLQVVMTNHAAQFFGQLEPRPCPPMWPIRGALDGDLDHVFRQFVQDIELAYERVDSVLPSPEADADVPLFNRPQTSATVKAHVEEGAEQLYVEMRHAYALPFTLSQVKRVLPLAASTEFARQNREIAKYQVTENVFGVKFLVRPDETITVAGNEETVTCLVRIYEEPGRVVVVWRGFMAARNGDFAEALSVTTGWTIFRPLKDVENHVAVHVCCRSVPLRSELVPSTGGNLARMPAETPEVGAFTTQMLCNAADVIPSITDSMENMLLDEAIHAQPMMV